MIMQNVPQDQMYKLASLGLSSSFLEFSTHLYVPSLKSLLIWFRKEFWCRAGTRWRPISPTPTNLTDGQLKTFRFRPWARSTQAREVILVLHAKQGKHALLCPQYSNCVPSHLHLHRFAFCSRLFLLLPAKAAALPMSPPTPRPPIPWPNHPCAMSLFSPPVSGTWWMFCIFTLDSSARYMNLSFPWSCEF